MINKSGPYMSTSPTRLKIAWRGTLTLALLCIGTGIGHTADVEAGKVIATKGNDKGVPPCGACHGANGEGQATSAIPRLAGLNAAYLQGQLAAFGSGTRDNAMMSPIAKTMDATSMADAAAFYASVPAPETSVPEQSKAAVAQGEAIALRGDWDAEIPPCAACHGKQGRGVGAAFPAIAGQSSAYITNQLLAWKKGSRHDDPLGLMKTVAGRLSDAQIAAVATYYEALPAASRDSRETKP